MVESLETVYMFSKERYNIVSQNTQTHNNSNILLLTVKLRILVNINDI